MKLKNPARPKQSKMYSAYDLKRTLIETQAEATFSILSQKTSKNSQKSVQLQKV